MDADPAQLGLKRVLSFWASFITSSHINNFAQNSFAKSRGTSAVKSDPPLPAGAGS